jgi:AcrR family transcriptional regulator
MQEIADHAGVNKALLHYHFRSKTELARAVWLRIASSFVPGIFQMMASDISLDEKIDRFVIPITPDSPSTHICSAMSLAKRRAILISSVTSTRRSDARQHGGRLSVCASRSMNAPSGKRSRLSRLISS